MHTESSSSEAPAIRFSNVSKHYASQRALHQISFEVRRGECFGLVGANGAGKTTLLKCLLDFIAPSEGQIEIFGVTSALPHARARLAYLPERFMPPYYLKGLDFLKYLLSLHRQPFDRAQLDQMLNALDLSADAMRKPVRAYSKGMTQKLGLAGCLLSGADLLVLDEPASGLDPKARALMKECIGRWVSSGRSVLLTSHALADVEQICHRLAVLHLGQLRFYGTPDCMRQRYGAASLEAAFLACIDAPG